MRESQVVLEWQREAKIELTKQHVIELIEIRTGQSVPDNLQRTIMNQTDLDVLSQWHRIAAQAETFEGFETAIQ